MRYTPYDAWFRSNFDLTEPWLIIGKGPSYGRYLKLPKDHGHNTLGINNVCRFKAVDATLIIDLHNVAQNLDILESNTRFLVMPWYPHERNKPSRSNLEQHSRDSAVLRHLARDGRLIVFNSTLSRRQKPGPGPWVHVRYFSGVAAVSLLAVAGVKKIRTLGIDPGVPDYHPLFDKKNLFINGRNSFACQEAEIDKLCSKYQLDYAMLA